MEDNIDIQEAGCPVGLSTFRNKSNLSDVVKHCFKKRRPHSYAEFLKMPDKVLAQEQILYKFFYKSQKSRDKSPVNRIHIKEECSDEERQLLLSFPKKKERSSRKSTSSHISSLKPVDILQTQPTKDNLFEERSHKNIECLHLSPKRARVTSINEPIETLVPPLSEEKRNRVINESAETINVSEENQTSNHNFPVKFQTFLMNTNIKSLANEYLTALKNEAPSSIDVHKYCLKWYVEFYSKQGRSNEIFRNLFVRADFADEILKSSSILPTKPIIQSEEIILPKSSLNNVLQGLTIQYGNKKTTQKLINNNEEPKEGIVEDKLKSIETSSEKTNSLVQNQTLTTSKSVNIKDNWKFPVSFKTFCNYTRLEPNTTNENQKMSGLPKDASATYEIYKAYFTNEETRKKLNIKLKPMPQSYMLKFSSFARPREKVPTTQCDKNQIFEPILNSSEEHAKEATSNKPEICSKSNEINVVNATDLQHKDSSKGTNLVFPEDKNIKDDWQFPVSFKTFCQYIRSVGANEVTEKSGEANVNFDTYKAYFTDEETRKQLNIKLKPMPQSCMLKFSSFACPREKVIKNPEKNTQQVSANENLSDMLTTTHATDLITHSNLNITNHNSSISANETPAKALLSPKQKDTEKIIITEKSKSQLPQTLEVTSTIVNREIQNISSSTMKTSTNDNTNANAVSPIKENEPSCGNTLEGNTNQDVSINRIHTADNSILNNLTDDFISFAGSTATKQIVNLDQNTKKLISDTNLKEQTEHEVSLTQNKEECNVTSKDNSTINKSGKQTAISNLDQCDQYALTDENINAEKIPETELINIEGGSQITNSGSTNQTDSSSGSVLRLNQELPTNSEEQMVQCQMTHINDLTDIQTQSLLRPNLISYDSPKQDVVLKEDLNTSHYITMPNTQQQSAALNVSRSLYESVIDPLNIAISSSTSLELNTQQEESHEALPCSSKTVVDNMVNLIPKSEPNEFVPLNKLKFILNESSNSFQIGELSDEIINVDNSQEKFSSKLCSLNAQLMALVANRTDYDCRLTQSRSITDETFVASIDEVEGTSVPMESNLEIEDFTLETDVLNNVQSMDPPSANNCQENCVENLRPKTTNQVNKEVPQLLHKFRTLPLQKQSKK